MKTLFERMLHKGLIFSLRNNPWLLVGEERRVVFPGSGRLMLLLASEIWMAPFKESRLRHINIYD